MKIGMVFLFLVFSMQAWSSDLRYVYQNEYITLAQSHLKFKNHQRAEIDHFMKLVVKNLGNFVTETTLCLNILSNNKEEILKEANAKLALLNEGPFAYYKLSISKSRYPSHPLQLDLVRRPDILHGIVYFRTCLAD